MKKIITVLMLALMIMPAYANEEGRANVRVGKIRAKVVNANEDALAQISRAGDVYTFGVSFARSKVNGLKTSSLGIAMALQFDSIGELEAGKTYDLSHSAPTQLTTLVAATRFKNLKGIAYDSVSADNFDDTNFPTATGKLKITEFDSVTGLASGNLVVTVKPIAFTRGGKSRVASKGVKIRMKFKDIEVQ
jgi:hypothetical protein